MIPVRYNIRSLLVRRTTSLMTALGVGMVVMLLLLLSGFINGMRTTINSAARKGTWLLLQRGIKNEGGFIPREQFYVIRSRAEIETDKDGNALISPEFVRGFNPTTNEPRRQFGLIRGVSFVDAQRVHRGLHLLSGHWPRHGQNEWVVGETFAARFPNLTPGRQFRLGGRDFRIVGVFSDDGSAREAEAWTDLEDLLQAFHVAAAGYSAIHVALRPGSEESFKKALISNASLLVDVMSETQYYEDQSKFTDQFRALGLVVAIVLGVGSVFGGMNTMYAAVARRSREVGVLRVLGFGRRDILLSFLVESVLLGISGGVAGSLLCLLTIFATGLNSSAMTVFTLAVKFRLSIAAVLAGLVASLAIGTLGGFLPALRATHIEVVDSLREA
jgi:ABC-type lipoprotein release transport system permease subunit